MRRHEDHGEAPGMPDLRRFGCTTSGEELLDIGRALRTAVGGHLVERARTPNGLVLRIARHPGAADALREYARREQACCSFFDIAITEGAETLSLRVSGPPDASPLLDLLYQLAQPPVTAR